MPMHRNTGRVLMLDEWVELLTAAHDLAGALRQASEWVGGHVWLVETMRESDTHSIRVQP